MIGLKNDEGTNERQNRRGTFNAQHSTLNVQGNEKIGRQCVQNYFGGVDSHCPSDRGKVGA